MKPGNTKKKEPALRRLFVSAIHASTVEQHR